jgi:hypothetical protein
MQLKLKQPMFWPLGTAFIAPVGTVLDVPAETATDWIKRGMALEEKPIPYRPPVLESPPVKGKK